MNRNFDECSDEEKVEVAKALSEALKVNRTVTHLRQAPFSLSDDVAL